MSRPGELAAAVLLTVATIAGGYALYKYAQSADIGHVSQPQWVALQTEPVGEPVRVANPFDSSEVFEFPAGTSEADAHEAIAGFLIERASRRGVIRDHRHSGPKS
jgi:hypothetical protein